MRNNRKRFPVLLVIIPLWVMVACLPGDTYEAHTWTPEPSLTATEIPLTHTPAPPTFQGPTPTISTDTGTPGATPIGGEPTLPPVNLDCAKTYTDPRDNHSMCIVRVIAFTQEFDADGLTGQEFSPLEYEGAPNLLIIDLSVSRNDRCVLRGSSYPDNPSGYRWVNCNHVIAIAE